jgi:hypothetical protein
MTCNRCYEPLRPDQAVEPSFSGRYPYVHADPVDCPALRAERRSSGPVPPSRLVRDIEPDAD